MINQYNEHFNIPPVYQWTQIFSKVHHWDRRLQRMLKKDLSVYSAGSNMSWANLNRIAGPPKNVQN
tara:strand:- start:248 stop:445 length:198 start_codon:yes stop_codon:yes gene_type:complete